MTPLNVKAARAHDCFSIELLFGRQLHCHQLSAMAIAPRRIEGARQLCSSSELRTSMRRQPPTDDADRYDDAMLMLMLMFMMVTLMLTLMTTTNHVYCEWQVLRTSTCTPQ